MAGSLRFVMERDRPDALEYGEHLPVPRGPSVADVKPLEYAARVLRASGYDIVPVQFHGGRLVFGGVDEYRDVDDWANGLAWIKRDGSDETGGTIPALLADLSTIDAWLQGDVCGFAINDEAGNLVDSLWGFYGPDALESAMEDGLETARQLYAAEQDNAAWAASRGIPTKRDDG